MGDQTAKYKFHSWVRYGFEPTTEDPGTKIEENGTETEDLPDSIGETKIGVRLKEKVGPNSQNTTDVEKEFQLYGPGDVIGFDKGQIVRMEPKPKTEDFAPNHFPFIEFDDPSFPWAFSPFTATEEDRLRPWICLIVVEKRKGVSLSPEPATPLPVLTIESDPNKELPPPNQTWAWAHAQKVVTGSSDEGESEREAIDKEAENTLSRIMAPRHLDPNQAYYACVVPVFKQGKRAGLGRESGQSGNGKPGETAWTDDENSVRLPVYHYWEFSTGKKGDFEALAERLDPSAIRNVGSRRVRAPLEEWEDAYNEMESPPEGVKKVPEVDLGGALRTPNTKVEERYIDLQQEALLSVLNQTLKADRPVLGPPVYGRWHAEVEKLKESQNSEREDSFEKLTEPTWVGELSLQPANRLAAGFGTRVVQKHQEALMASAWEQVGEIREANQLLSRSQLAREASRHIHSALFAKGGNDAEQLLLSGPAQTRVTAEGHTKTIFGKVNGGDFPHSWFSAALRRLLRREGPLGRRLGVHPADWIGGLIEELRDQNGSTLREKMSPKFHKSKGLLTVPPDDQVDFLKTPCEETESVEMHSRQQTKWHQFFQELGEFGSDESVDSDESDEPTLHPGLKDLYPESEGEPSEGLKDLKKRLPETFRSLPSSEEYKNWLEEGAKEDAWVSDFSEVVCEKEEASEDIPKPNLSNLAQRIRKGLNPNDTIPDRVLERIGGRDDLGGRLDPIDPIMAAPEFLQPMYRPLRDLSRQYLVPGVDKIEPNTIGLLETNPVFVDAYMVGLSHEMARELRWRRYPTDLRGTYFKNFWDSRGVDTLTEKSAEELHDIQPPIHQWDNGLGDSGADPPLVLMIKGDLFRRYPRTKVYAVRAMREGEEKLTPKISGPISSEDVQFPIFSGRMEPDINFFGFDLDHDEAYGEKGEEPGWYFVQEEATGEPRFGLEVGAGKNGGLESWDELHWGTVPKNSGEYVEFEAAGDSDSEDPLFSDGDPRTIDEITWREDAAQMASITWIKPFRRFVHAREMLPEPGDEQ